MPNEKGDYLRIFLEWSCNPSGEQKLTTGPYGVLRIFKAHNLGILIATLCVIGWQQVSAGVGLLKEIIMDHFPIEERDIYVFIFCA